MSRPLTYFLERKREEPDWIIPGLLKRQNSLFLVGIPKKAVKSWLLFNLAWDLSEGKPVWGIENTKTGFLFKPKKPMRVIFFTQEDTEDDLHDRYALMSSSGRQPNENLWYVQKDLTMCFDNEKGIEKIDSHLQEASPVDLVIFDPFRRMHYASENDSEVIAKLWKIVSVICKEYNCSVMFSHHIVKPPRGSVNRVGYDEADPMNARGSGDIYGGADSFITVVPKNTRGNPELSLHQEVSLSFQTKRGRPLPKVSLSVSFETGLVTFNHFGSGRPKEELSTARLPSYQSVKSQ